MDKLEQVKHILSWVDYLKMLLMYQLRNFIKLSDVMNEVFYLEQYNL